MESLNKITRMMFSKYPPQGFEELRVQGNFQRKQFVFCQEFRQCLLQAYFTLYQISNGDDVAKLQTNLSAIILEDATG